MKSSIRTRWTCVGWSGWLCLFWAIVPQTALSEDLLIEESSEATRQQQYAELARDVELLETQFNIVKRVVRLVRPTVVHIEAQKNGRYERRFGQRAEDIEEAGSGVIIELSQRKYVLTNRHVIRDADKDGIKIHLYDGRILHPIQVWEDLKTDVAIMDLENAQELVAAVLGDSSRTEIGDFVLAVGSPFGLSQSVTYGMISAKGRHELDLGDREGEVEFQNFLQTDAAINPGNSGGPLINLRGEVIGLNTAIASSSGGNEGIGFSIPINTAVLIARQLVEHGHVARAFLGVTLDAEYDSTARFTADGSRYVQGARVRGVTDNSPAAEVGIQAGDVILAFDNVRIQNLEHLINVVGLTEVGREVNVILFRNGQTHTVSVRVTQRQESQ